MSKCRNCGVIIADDAHKCPLCQQVLEDAEGGNNKYPDVRDVNKKLHIACNIILFVSLVVGCSLILIDYETGDHLVWSLIVTLVLVYVNVLMRLTVKGKSGYQFKTICTAFIGIAVLYGIDILTGNHGWALNYVYPGLIMAMDVTILILMIVNRRNWQSYLMTQLIVILLSLVPLFLYFGDVVYDPYIILISILISGFLFLGTVIIGDSRARNELKRRFHI